MRLLELLNELEKRGIQLESQAGKLKLKAPEGAMTPDLLAQLKANKVALLELLEDRKSGPQLKRRQIDKSGHLPLSFAQERIWFLTELDPESAAAYNVVAAIRIQGELQVSFLERAINEVIVRHEMLRTRFENVQGNPAQVIEPTLSIAIEKMALSELKGEDTSSRLDGCIREEASRAFDLSQLPLMRTKLIECGVDEHVFLFVLHHIVTDDWSSGVLIREIATLYQGYVEGQAATLPELDFQFCDYVDWQTDWMASPAYDAALNFWKQRLEGTPVLNLCTDHPRTAQQSYEGNSIFCHYPTSLSDGLEALANSENVTLYSVLLAAFKVLLYRYTGQLDIAVGSPVANRSLKAIEGLIGFFTNTVVYRTQINEQSTFVDVLRTLNEQVRESQDYQDMPFEKLVEAINPERNMGVNPLFQVCFSMLHAYRDELRLGDLELTRLDYSSPTARFDFTVMVEKTVDGLRVDVEYCTALFDASTVRRFLQHYQVLLEGIVANPQMPLFALPLASTEEIQCVVERWNETTTDYPADQCVHTLFEQMVQEYPQATALVSGEQSMTYEALNVEANQLARYLRTLGVGPDVGVAVCARRSIPMLVALLGTLKAGGYYLPFDEADPQERLRGLFEDTQVKAILAPREVLETMPEGDATEVAWEDANVWSSCPIENLENLNDAKTLAYVTFTSGSTGKPKGIMIPHHGVTRLVRDTNYMEYGHELTILELAPVSFDASTFELWGALCNGAKMVIMPPEKPSIQSLSTHIEKYDITSMYLTSAMFNLMVEEKLDALCRLKHLLVGGDIISVNHAKKLLAANSGVALINGYGPTETTTFAGCHSMVKPEDVGYTVSIGKAISNTELYVLDKFYNPQPVGVPGDLYIAGDGNARGYFNLPELTAECFVPNPFGKRPGELMYRTGDLARFAEDGTLEFLGRCDNQVKVRGFRIELGEIENNMREHPEVKEVAVIAKDEGLGSKRLIGFYQPASGVTLEEQELRSFLEKSLPDYMIPTAMVKVESFPLNVHNKINRKSLHQLWSEEQSIREDNYVAPANVVEEVLALIWSNVLKVEQVSVEDNFFQIGGHSLLATRIIWKVFEVFGIEVPLKTLFLYPTIKSLAQELMDLENEPGRSLAAAKVYLKLNQMSPAEVVRMLEERKKAVSK